MFGLTIRLLSARCPNALAATLASVVFAGAVTVLGCIGESDTPLQEVAESAVVATADDGAAALNATSRHVMVVFGYCPVPDPAIDESYASRGIGAHSLVTEIHAGLTRIDETNGNEVKPELAESYVVRDGGMTYEFTLRKGLKFSDGSDLTAEDVKWSWERSLRLSKSWTYARDAFGSIVGADRVIQGASVELEGLAVVDESTLTVNLASPVPLFPMLIAGPTAAVLKAGNVSNWPVRWTNSNLVESASPPIDYSFQAVGGTGADPTVVGAGPFKLSEYQADDAFAECSIIRNVHYWGPPANLDAVKFSPNPGGGSAGTFTPDEPLSWFANGDVDFVPVVRDSVDYDLQESLGVNVTEVAAQLYTFFVAFNPSFPPMDDIHFRRALVLSAEPAKLHGHEIGWEKVIVPPRLVEFRGRVEGIAANIESAARELTKSKYAGKMHDSGIEMYTDGADGRTLELETLFAIWTNVLGIRAELKHIETFGEYQSMQDGAQVPLRAFAINPVYPDPHAVLRVFDGAFGTGGGPSSNDESVIALLRRAKTEGDPGIRLNLYEELEQHILDQALALPIYVDWLDPQILVQPWVHNFNLNQFGGSVFHGIWFDETAPERTLP